MLKYVSMLIKVNRVLLQWMMQLIVISILRKQCGNRLRKSLSVHEMTNESFDSSPDFKSGFIGWLKEKFKLLNLNNKAKLEIGMQIATLRFFSKKQVENAI